MAGDQPAEGETLRHSIARALTRGQPVAEAIVRRTHQLAGSLRQVSVPGTDGRVDPVALDLIEQASAS